MGPTNISLVKLFHADQALREAQERLEAATKNVRIQERKVNDLTEKLRLAQIKHKELQAKSGNLDLDLRSREWDTVPGLPRRGGPSLIGHDQRKRRDPGVILELGSKQTAHHRRLQTGGRRERASGQILRKHRHCRLGFRPRALRPWIGR